MYEIRILDSARNMLIKSDKNLAIRLMKKIHWLGENVKEISHESLGGDLSDYFKLRVGDYRILYKINHENKLLIIHFIGHRSEIYKSK